MWNPGHWCQNWLNVVVHPWYCIAHHTYWSDEHVKVQWLKFVCPWGFLISLFCAFVMCHRRFCLFLYVLCLAQFCWFVAGPFPQLGVQRSYDSSNWCWSALMLMIICGLLKFCCELPHLMHDILSEGGLVVCIDCSNGEVYLRSRISLVNEIDQIYFSWIISETASVSSSSVDFSELAWWCWAASTVSSAILIWAIISKWEIIILIASMTITFVILFTDMLCCAVNYP